MTRKFMQSFDETMLRRLKRGAKKRGIGVQELLRAVVIPDWLGSHRGRERDPHNARSHKPNKGRRLKK